MKVFMSKIFCLLLQSFVVLSSLGISSTSFANSPIQKKKCSLGSDDWIETKFRQYPELLWLIENNNKDVKTSLNSLDINKNNASLLKETLTSLIYFHAFLNGSHSSYLLLKKQNPKLGDYTFKEFLSMHKKFKYFFKSFNPEISQNEFIRIVETSIVLKNIYSSEKAKKLFENYFISPTNCREEFYSKSFQVLNSFPELSPSFRHLTKQGQSLVSQARTFINYKNLLSLFLDKKTSPKIISSSYLNFDLLIFLIDLCGEENYSASIQNDFFALVKNIQQNFDFNTKSLVPIYQAQLQYEAEKYGEQLDSLVNIPYIRLAKSFNLTTPEEFFTFKQIITSLDEETQESLINYLSHFENNPPLVGLYELKEKIFHTLTAAGHKDLLKKSLNASLAIVIQGISSYKEQKNVKSFPLKELNFSNIKIDSLFLDNLDKLLIKINKNGEMSFSMSSK